MRPMSDRELLKRLGTGETIDQVSADQGWDRAAFDQWWGRLVAARLPDTESTADVGVGSAARIVRDERGIPHVLADNDDQNLALANALAHAPALLHVHEGWMKKLEHLGVLPFGLVVGGGVVYSVGAVIYARRSPNPAPTVFGYHEIFHVLVLVAAACHYVAIWDMVV